MEPVSPSCQQSVALEHGTCLHSCRVGDISSRFLHASMGLGNLFWPLIYSLPHHQNETEDVILLLIKIETKDQACTNCRRICSRTYQRHDSVIWQHLTQIGSKVMLKILVIEWETNGFPKPMEAKWQSEDIPTWHELHISVMFKSDILLTQLKNNFHFPPPFLVSTSLFLHKLEEDTICFSYKFVLRTNPT